MKNINLYIQEKLVIGDTTHVENEVVFDNVCDFFSHFSGYKKYEEKAKPEIKKFFHSFERNVDFTFYVSVQGENNWNENITIKEENKLNADKFDKLYYKCKFPVGSWGTYEWYDIFRKDKNSFLIKKNTKKNALYLSSRQNDGTYQQIIVQAIEN